MLNFYCNSGPALQQKPKNNFIAEGVEASPSVTQSGKGEKGISLFTPPLPYGGSGSDGNSSGTKGSISLAVSGSSNSTELPSTSHTGSVGSAATGNTSPGPVRGSMSTLAPQSVQVSAVCSNDGVNVTVSSSQVAQLFLKLQ